MMEMLYKDTVDYTSQRIQFDHPLSEFQTVKHRMAEMFTETELCRSILYRATMELDNGNPDAELDNHALKYMIGKNGRFIGQSAVQLHGGMGQTEELRIGQYFIRLAVIDTQIAIKKLKEVHTLTHPAKSRKAKKDVAFEHISSDDFLDRLASEGEE